MNLEPEPYLDDKAVEYFHRIVDNLQGLDALHDVDSIGISMMAFDLWLYYECANKISTDGSGGKQTTQSGYQQVTADITIMEKCKTSFLKFSERFGMSPADREKMLAFKRVKKVEDDFDGV